VHSPAPIPAMKQMMNLYMSMEFLSSAVESSGGWCYN